MSEQKILVPDASHPISVKPTGERVRVYVGDQVIAETTDALTLQEAGYPAVQYIPRSALDPSVALPSQTHSYCPYKGQADYLSVRVGETEIADAGWFYPQAHDAVAEITDHVAWYPDRVRVEVG